jgi:hypothetical protein
MHAPNKLAALAALVLALAAAPAALAASGHPRPDDRAGARGPAATPPLALPAPNRFSAKLAEIGAWAVPSASSTKPLVSDSQQTSVREKLGETGAWAIPMGENATGQHAPAPSAARPDDRAGIRGPAIPAAPTPTISVANGGFDWSSAGIGAGAGAGTILALLGAFLLIRPDRLHAESA